MSSLQINDLAILLVEPSGTQQKIIANNLTKSGVTKIDCVTDGKNAIDYLEKTEPDLVISAMYFPDMTAIELVTHIRAQEAINHIPFMLISSEFRFRMLDPLKQAGVVAVLPKPFDFEALERALKNTIHFLEPDELDLDNYDPTTLRVLVVDDSSTARRFITRTLKGLGIENIEQADDGKSAIELLNKNNEFDLIVTDYNMPEVDGKELVMFIRGNEMLTHIPVLMVTSEQNRAILNNIEQVGVSAICDKPFEPQNVTQLLANLLN